MKGKTIMRCKLYSILLIASLFIAPIGYALDASVPSSSNTPAITDTQHGLKGKIVIVILDISGSIKRQFPYIIEIVDDNIVKERLEVGDYFVLIPFGDAALPMYSGQLLRQEDKVAISNTLHALKADNDYTDIGQAIKRALEEIKSLKQQDFDLYEPLVLFITDGDLTTATTSTFHNMTVEDIFQDSLFSDTSLYKGWYYVGIGTNLHDLPKIARLSDRQEYLLNIQDLSTLSTKLDEWIKKIPESKSIEVGKLVFKDFSLGGSLLDRQKPILEGETVLGFTLGTTYNDTTAIVELKDCSAIYQSENKALSFVIPIEVEKGRIPIAPKESVASDARLVMDKASSILGQGTIKLHFSYSVNSIDKESDYSFPIYICTKKELYIKKFTLPGIIFLSILFIALIAFMISARKPVKVVLELLGKGTRSTVAIGVGQAIEFGSKPGLRLRLDPNMFCLVVGKLERRGVNKWLILPRDTIAFNGNTKAIAYTMGENIPLRSKSGSSVNIRFSLR